MAIDPICKKTVDEKTAPSSVYKNKEYYFCSEECKKKFDELDKSVIRVRRSLKDKERISFGKLKREIIDPGICTLCGACVASCEVLEVVAGKPTLKGPCTACGVCYNQCPRTITTESSLIGSVRDVFTARTLLSEVKGQDGGVVTSMLLYGLEEGLIDSAVVTVKSDEEPWKPVPIVAQTREDILRSAGSIYVHSLTMESLMSAIKVALALNCNIAEKDGILAPSEAMKCSFSFTQNDMKSQVLIRTGVNDLGEPVMNTLKYHVGNSEQVEFKCDGGVAEPKAEMETMEAETA